MNYLVAVRALCEFTAKRGDLDLRFTPAPSAQEGIAGHALVQGRRPPGYQSEVRLEGTYRHLQIRGRADGYDPAQGQLEEIKTHRGDLSLMPDNQRELHWAQLRIYGHLFLQQRSLGPLVANADSEAENTANSDSTDSTNGNQPIQTERIANNRPATTSPEALPHLRLALVYFDIDQERETVFYEHHTAATLQHYFEQQCAIFLDWADAELAQRAQRNAELDALRFPFAGFRSGQRELAASVYNAQRKSCCLLAQAPTGIGKTIASLFPALKACPGQKIDKVFFLTAKTPGRQLALDALQQMQAATPALRVLELVARDKACVYPELACHGESCPLARGFYDRLPAARSAALAAGTGALDQAQLAQIAQAHQVCPYYLSQELARWADVIIGDYNYYFDISAMLYSMAKLASWRVSLLVDEAHNLLARGRSMYSAELTYSNLRAARKHATPALKKALGQVQKHWRALGPAPAPQAAIDALLAPASAQSDLLTAASAQADLLPAASVASDGNAQHSSKRQPRQQAPQGDYRRLPKLPAGLVQALQQACSAIGDCMLQHPQPLPPDLQHFYFYALHFIRVAELFDEHSILDLERPPQTTNEAILTLRNLIPAPFLRERFAHAHACTLFSATLSPPHFYQDTLGLPEDSHWVDIASPFHAGQLNLQVVRHISTRYQHRRDSLPALVALIAQQYQRQNGNYLAFFSSFDYLEQVVQALAQNWPSIPFWQQTRRMEESERNDFLARFTPDGRGIGFAVLGGNFAEGIDLPGTRLVGAFIATLGLPQLNPVNEQLLQCMQNRFGSGYAYTYLYPGLQKVVQAAGRVIRTTSDTGSVFLIDDRFSRAEVQALFPAWWKVGYLPLPLQPDNNSSDDATVNARANAAI